MTQPIQYDVQVWLREREQTLQRGEWLVAHPGVSRYEAVGLAAQAARQGERARIVRSGTAEWAQCFEVRADPGQTLEACFWCESDADRYVRLLCRELGVASCSVRELWRCYACDATAVGYRDRRPEGGGKDPACGRHREMSASG